MRIEKTLTYRDIKEIPGLLKKFSAGAQGLKKSVLKSKRNAVFLVGRGSSGNATLFAKYVWEEYCGVVSNIVHPYSVFEAKKKMNFRSEVVWAFSQSGRSEDVAHCLKKLKAWGAKGVAVTNEPDLKKNALAGEADRHILLSNSPELPVAATKTFSLQLWSAMHAARIWGAPFSVKDFKKAEIETERFIKNLKAFNAGKYLPGIKKASIICFIGRGPFNAVAEDAALKFREMSRSHSLGYSAAEFLHGPVGSFSRKDFAFLLSPSKKIPEDLAKVAKALKERKAPFAVLKENKLGYPFNAILMDIKIKLLALNLALFRGLDPDNPAGLSKVTRTF